MSGRTSQPRSGAGWGGMAPPGGLARLPGFHGGQVSVWCARPGTPAAFTRDARRTHYAASLVKLPLLLAAYGAHERGELDLDERVPVREEFSSLVDGTYLLERDDDNDEAPWEHLGARVSLRWLAARMTVASSNLATNLLIERVGLDAVAAASPAGLELRRGIGDAAAAAAGITNSACAEAVGALLSGLLTRSVAGEAAADAMLALLRAQQYRAGIPAALPEGACLGNKSGWVTGVLHDAAVVQPHDAPAYVLVVCTTGFDESTATSVIHRVTAASWAERGLLGEPAVHGERGTDADR